MCSPAFPLFHAGAGSAGASPALNEWQEFCVLLRAQEDFSKREHKIREEVNREQMEKRILKESNEHAGDADAGAGPSASLDVGGDGDEADIVMAGTGAENEMEPESGNDALEQWSRDEAVAAVNPSENPGMFDDV